LCPSEKKITELEHATHVMDRRQISYISCAEVVVDAFSAPWNELAGVHAEVSTRVDYESPFAGPICDEEAAVVWGADMSHR
jgi:hypothetical protein